MAWAQGRLKELGYILNNAKIIDNTSLGHKKIAVIKIGSTIKFINIKIKQEKVFTIVGAQEADPQNSLISNESPLGQAFIGKMIGDKIKVKTPAGEQEYEIMTIS
jgi:transcription elongation factor GreA